MHKCLVYFTIASVSGSQAFAVPVELESLDRPYLVVLEANESVLQCLRKPDLTIHQPSAVQHTYCNRRFLFKTLKELAFSVPSLEFWTRPFALKPFGSMSQPALLLIPGAWHGANSYDRITSILEKEGYTCQALTLPSVGAEPPLTSAEPDIAYIRQNISSLLDHGLDIVLVMHSYGAIPGSSSLRGLSREERTAANLPGGVIALVYLCAWMTAEGQSVRSSGGGQGGKGGPKRVQVEGDYIHHLDPVGAFYQDLPIDVAKHYARGLRHHSSPTLFAPLTFAAYKHIPTTYLFCTQDDTIPYERQLKLVEDAGVPITTFTCSAGHSPFLSQPELTARVIRHAAGEKIEVEN